MKNPPVVEVIAEVRWGEGNPRQPAQFAFGQDAGYVTFGMQVGQAGYQQVERTIPEGFPSPGGSVVYRYRKNRDVQNTLYQLGPGVFTTNGLPPYTSWSEFTPVLANGLDALWLSVFSNKGSEPVWLILRYVDLFTEQHLAGLGREQFFEQAVGLRYTPTAAQTEFAPDAPHFQMRFFASRVDEEGRELSVDFGQGVEQRTGRPGIVMSTQVLSQKLNDPTKELIVSEFDRLQRSAHDVFFQMLERCPLLKANIWGEADGEH